MMKNVKIIGAGLAGSEAALQLARRGIRVTLVEMRPQVPTAVHKTDACAELVCSNSLKSTKPESAAGMLKAELAALEELLSGKGEVHIDPDTPLYKHLSWVTALRSKYDITPENAHDVLRQGVQSISQLIKVPGLVNLDFADVTAVMKDAGCAHMGVGRAEGKDKAELAAQAAIASPLLETSIDGARGVIINITAANDIDLEEVEVASNLVSRAAHPDANIIWGVAFDDNMDDEMCVTVIATGFSMDGSYKAKEMPAAGESKVSKEIPAPEEDADYIDIMSIFNKKRD